MRTVVCKVIIGGVYSVGNTSQQLEELYHHSKKENYCHSLSCKSYTTRMRMQQWHKWEHFCKKLKHKIHRKAVLLAWWLSNAPVRLPHRSCHALFVQQRLFWNDFFTTCPPMSYTSTKKLSHLLYMIKSNGFKLDHYKHVNCVTKYICWNASNVIVTGYGKLIEVISSILKNSFGPFAGPTILSSFLFLLNTVRATR